MVSLKQIQALDAVVREGSFQAGAKILHKTHPSVISLLGKLEGQLGFALFDRSGYRTTLTDAGRHIKGTEIDIVVARPGAGHHGVMAEYLWKYFQDRGV